MLTSLDILKLCIPFAFALALIWIRERIIAGLEKKRKQNALWEILMRNSSTLTDVDDFLLEVADAHNLGKISPRVFVVASAPDMYLKRLAELDHEYASVYSELEIEEEGSRKRIETLDKLREQFYKEAHEDGRKKLAEAIRETVELSRQHHIALAEKELEVLKRIQKARNKSKQELLQFEEAIRALKTRKAE